MIRRDPSKCQLKARPRRVSETRELHIPVRLVRPPDSGIRVRIEVRAVIQRLLRRLDELVRVCREVRDYSTRAPHIKVNGSKQMSIRATDWNRGKMGITTLNMTYVVLSHHQLGTSLADTTSSEAKVLGAC